MRFVTVRDFRSKSAQIWRSLPKEQEMVVTLNGKPVALLTPVTEDSFDSEVSALRRARAAAAVLSMQLTSLRNGNDRMTLSEINAEIAATRKARRG